MFGSVSAEWLEARFSLFSWKVRLCGGFKMVFGP